MRLTKTDFVQFLNCQNSLWLLKREPENYPHGEVSVFLKKLTREGYEVEKFVRQYFEGLQGRMVDFQRVFETNEGLYSRAEVIETTDDGNTTLYEVKSSTSVKTDSAHNHIKDVCFQKICAERSGQKIDRVFVVHLNGAYIRDGEIDPAGLLKFSDVTEVVGMLQKETEAEIDQALHVIAQPEVDRDGCSCVYSSRSHHCDSFAIFNPDIPKPSIYSLPRLSAKKRHGFVSDHIFNLKDVPDDYPLSDIQKTVSTATKVGKPQINLASIREFLSAMVFPLSFFDYETFASAVPFLEGTSPHKHFAIQYSLHILEADGSLTHKEFLEREVYLSDRLIEKMEADIGAEGSVVSWHASFEKTQNREMAKLFPQKAQFLAGLNDRMVDLENIFKLDFVDARFDGSTSIKKVLPVVCPKLSYKDLEIQDGASAMDAWQRMIGAEESEADEIATGMLRYCALDTLAMVEIYRGLWRLSR